jgi:hypothetical protein
MRWERSWGEKLERAQTFLTGLTRAGLPGTKQVSEQINKMEDEHNKDAWNIRQRFPPLHKASSIERVKIRTNAPRNSHLRKEVRPEDVVEPKVKGYMEGDDDDDYVRSTDPLHPVITDYSHPLDNSDDSWVDAYLSQEEARLPESPDIGFDPGSNAWNWGAPDVSDNWMDNHVFSPDFNTGRRSFTFVGHCWDIWTQNRGRGRSRREPSILSLDSFLGVRPRRRLSTPILSLILICREPAPSRSPKSHHRYEEDPYGHQKDTEQEHHGKAAPHLEQIKHHQ